MPTILITGANRGLGLELASQYAGAGWRVLACCRAPKAASELNRLASDSKERVAVHRMDVTNPAEIAATSKALKAEPVDVLFNNAGVLGGAIEETKPMSFGTLDYAMWEDVLRTNTLAPVRVAEAFVEQVAASERKLMVFMTTYMASITSLTDGGYYPYRASKAALNLVVKALSLDLKPKGIRTLAVHPGWVSTDMGGASAPVKAPDSVKGLRQVIERYGKAETGKFYNYDGNEFPW